MDRKTILNRKFKEQNGKCFWCDGRLSFEVASIEDYSSEFPKCYNKDGKIIPEVSDFCEIDHLIPRSLGGIDIIDNFVLSCAKCNQKKNGNIWIKNKDGSILEFYRPKKETKIEYKKNKIIITTIIELK